MAERELPYEMFLPNGGRPPDISPNHPALRLPIRIWRRLPYTLTRVIGPRLIRWAP
jgi:hypothetical protein